jgi:hypothetical protein
MYFLISIISCEYLYIQSSIAFNYRPVSSFTNAPPSSSQNIGRRNTLNLYSRVSGGLAHQLSSSSTLSTIESSSSFSSITPGAALRSSHTISHPTHTSKSGEVGGDSTLVQFLNSTTFPSSSSSSSEAGIQRLSQGEGTLSDAKNEQTQQRLSQK